MAEATAFEQLTRERVIPVCRGNRSGPELDATSITVHDTANSNRGADTFAHDDDVRCSWKIEISQRRVVDSPLLFL